MKNIIQEINKRKTLAIIAHPDAGKTTLTEKLLLYGNAIQEAGVVKSNKIKKTTISDFMEIEKQRGISVSTSVISFNYKGYKINILDTPGHEDFAEDTYRTLSAVDSVIVVIGASKGVEKQTIKLVEVCKMHKIPIIFFINKIDLECQDPFDLLDDIEKQLYIKKISILSWPIGYGSIFKGVYDLQINRSIIFKHNIKKNIDPITFDNIINIEIKKILGCELYSKLIDDIETINSIYYKFKIQDYLSCNLYPVLFGSALKNFGIKNLLDTFLQISPSPKYKKSNLKIIKPTNSEFSGFVFKIHANLDSRHHSRMAFIKIVSGIFQRNKIYYHVRKNKKIKFNSPISLFANKKNIVEIGYPGDIIGINDSGNFKIGDTITEGSKFQFQKIPKFSPEHFKYIINDDPLKYKQMEKGILELTDEGIAQIFTYNVNNKKIIGVVGSLQYDVLKYRLEHEYKARVSYENLNIKKAYWVNLSNANNEEQREFIELKKSYLATDKDGKLVLLVDSEFSFNMTVKNYPNIKFYTLSEF